MSFWSRVKGRKNKRDERNSDRHSQGCDGAAGRQAEARQSLANFLAALREDSSAQGEDSSTFTSWNSMINQRSRLSKSVKEFLVDPNGLGYLIGFLETRGAPHLVKFWLDVESFRLASSNKIHSGAVNPKGECQRLECVPEIPDTELEASPSSPASLDNQDGSQAPSESAESCDSGFCKSARPNGRPESGLSQPQDGNSSTDSDRDSVLRSDCDSLHSLSTDGFAEILKRDQAVEAGVEKDAASRAVLPGVARTEDALNIYKRYIAPDSAYPVPLPIELKKEIVELICLESGLVSPHCFDQAQAAVEDLLEEEDYFPHFLQSEFNAKHQVDILTSGQVLITDILYNDTALFHFMEFMEGEGQRPLVEFWMAANNFQQSIERLRGTPSPRPGSPIAQPPVAEGSEPSATTASGCSGNSEPMMNDATLDAMVLYDKFFSMQASTPLGFDDRIRQEIEKNICEEGGPGLHCFAIPLQLVARYLDQVYLQPFLTSKLFHNYVKDLIATIQLSPRGGAPGLLRRSTSSESISSCGSTDTTTSKISSTSGRRGPTPRNTLLASGGKLDSSVNMSIDCLSLSDPDSLWRRKPIRENVGRVDSLGRYCPGWEEAPDSTKMGVLTKAAKRLTGSGPQQNKLKEEMAWQVAESFIRDVTSITMSPENTPLDVSGRKLNCSATSGDLANYSRDLDWDSLCLGNMRKSKSDNFGLGYF